MNYKSGLRILILAPEVPFFVVRFWPHFNFVYFWAYFGNVSLVKSAKKTKSYFSAEGVLKSKKWRKQIRLTIQLYKCGDLVDGRHLVRGQAIALLQYFSIKGIFDFERTGASLHEIGMTKGNRLLSMGFTGRHPGWIQTAGYFAEAPGQVYCSWEEAKKGWRSNPKCSLECTKGCIDIFSLLAWKKSTIFQSGSE